jgi:hypothetical protein
MRLFFPQWFWSAAVPRPRGCCSAEKCGFVAPPMRVPRRQVKGATGLAQLASLSAIGEGDCCP